MNTLEPRPVSSAHYRWLRHELADWQTEGIVDAGTGRHASPPATSTPATGTAASRSAACCSSSAAAFVGVGLIWLVAANLDQLPPMLRFVAVAAIWLALIAAAELSRATRRRPRGAAADGGPGASAP